MNQHSSNFLSKEIDEIDNKSPLGSERIAQPPIEKQNLDSVKSKDTYASNVVSYNTEPSNNYLNDVELTEAKLIGKISSCF